MHVGRARAVLHVRYIHVCMCMHGACTMHDQRIRILCTCLRLPLWSVTACCCAGPQVLHLQVDVSDDRSVHVVWSIVRLL